MQSLRVGVTAGRFSPKIRPNRFLGFSRGFHFLVHSDFDSRRDRKNERAKGEKEEVYRDMD